MQKPQMCVKFWLTSKDVTMNIIWNWNILGQDFTQSSFVP